MQCQCDGQTRKIFGGKAIPLLDFDLALEISIFSFVKVRMGRRVCREARRYNNMGRAMKKFSAIHQTPPQVRLFSSNPVAEAMRSKKQSLRKFLLSRTLLPISVTQTW